MDVFVTGFWCLIILCVVLYLYTRTALPTPNDVNFSNFQKSYLVVYLLGMAGDWMQGPYVYALYDHYKMSTHDIELLFVAGFGSSMVFGTVVGSIADKYGRRSNCILYGILYGLACVTKHFNNFHILMVGRLLGGIATSILYSAFESWLVCEHNKRGFDSDLLSSIFSHATLGNSVVAIVAGLVAQQFADSFGYVAPFDVSLVVLMIMCLFLVSTWTENYGDATAHSSQSFKNAFVAIKTDTKVLCLGLIQSLFEGSMYTFVLEWTPALTTPESIPTPQKTSGDELPADDDGDGHRGSIPHGIIFAGFMVAIMIGSSLFKLLSKHSKVESFMRPVLFVSSVSLVMPILFPGNQCVIFTGFLVFEVCVGIFWPSLGTMRGKYVPEEARSTIMNFFRIPLNLIVVIILTQLLDVLKYVDHRTPENLPMHIIFSCCVIFLLVATVCQQWLYRAYLLLPPKNQQKSGGRTEENSESSEVLKEKSMKERIEEEEQKSLMNEQKEEKQGKTSVI